jgi:tRNA (guanine37-N1)-methyltransferase
MIRFEIITIFPEAFSSYFSQSIIARAQKKRLIKINIYNLRDFSDDPHKTVDDKPYGGGAGMILKVEPILKAVKFVFQRNKSIKDKDRKIILLSAKGRQFNQEMAKKLSKLKQVILIAGHYEGVDERVARYIADEEVSIGNYVLTGGELPAMVIVDAVTRLIPGVIKKESLDEESFSRGLDYLEYPQYTRPAVFDPKMIIKDLTKYPKQFKKAKFWKVPRVLLSGHHQKIKEWRKRHQKELKN